VGDTGVKDSFAHLHFSLSVLPNPGPGAREIFMDPEPLIALWPLKIPRWGGGADAAFEPGVPRGAAGRAHNSNGSGKKKKKSASGGGKESTGDEGDGGSETASAATEPATDTSSPPVPTP
ncbi:MAG TPA: hypothetical protein VIG06_13015, partial [Kofleriaceae bacterium]